MFQRDRQPMRRVLSHCLTKWFSTYFVFQNTSFFWPNIRQIIILMNGLHKRLNSFTRFLLQNYNHFKRKFVFRLDQKPFLSGLSLLSVGTGFYWHSSSQLGLVVILATISGNLVVNPTLAIGKWRKHRLFS